METVGQRLRRLRKEKKFTQKYISGLLHITDQTLSKYEKDVITNIPNDKIERLAELYNTTPAYIAGWEASDIVSKLSNYVPVEKKRIPLVGTIAAGQPILAEEHVEEYLPVNDNLHADFALKIQGDSMVNAGIYDGDIVFIQQMDDVEDGQIAAVLIDDSATLKRVYKMDGMIRLVPENPKYQPMIFSPTNCDTCKILGKAVAVLSRL